MDLRREFRSFSLSLVTIFSLSSLSSAMISAIDEHFEPRWIEYDISMTYIVRFIVGTEKNYCDLPNVIMSKYSLYKYLCQRHHLPESTFESTLKVL